MDIAMVAGGILVSICQALSPEQIDSVMRSWISSRSGQPCRRLSSIFFASSVTPWPAGILIRSFGSPSAHPSL
jgi:hypothetical protein